MTKVLITGGAGFIGSHLTDRCIDLGYDVIILDNLSTGRIDNIKKHSENPHLTFINDDLSNISSHHTLLDRIDYIFHLAGLADIVPSINHPGDYHHANVNGTFKLLEFFKEAPIKKFVYAASASCYGMPTLFPTPENYQKNPQYPYALTKYLAEEYVLHWGQVYDLPVISLRLFNAYGPRSRTSGVYGAVFGVFLAQKLAGHHYTIIGDGEQTRDFTFVDDIIDAFLLSAQSSVTQKIYNVGASNPQSINKLVQLLGGEIEYIPHRPGEPTCTMADISKIQSELGWRPKTSFEKGVQVMLDHISDWKDSPVWTKSSIGDATEDWFKYLGDKS